MARRILLTITCALALQLLLLGSAFAQDFGSLVASAASANQQWVTQIDTALSATSLAAIQSQAAVATATGEQVQTLLTQALAVAPNDAARSRVQGVLNHVTAAVNAGKAVVQATDVNTARSQVNAMRGEAVEAASELVPFASSVAPTPTGPATTLPKTGGFSFISLIVGALGILIAGLGFRRMSAERSAHVDADVEAFQPIPATLNASSDKPHHD